MDSLKQITAQLSWGHGRAAKSSSYNASSDSAAAVEDVATQLLAASRFLSAARDALRAAEAASGEVLGKRSSTPDPSGVDS